MHRALMRAQHIEQSMTVGERLSAKVIRAREFGFPIAEEVIEERRAIAAQEQNVLRAHR
ncbi:MAG TPA: hypothetical protein VFB85_25300 [Vicinamibacterales bacterium]|nr:hypothetical protein [Vicinamibacterales bacterium]